MVLVSCCKRYNNFTERKIFLFVQVSDQTTLYWSKYFISELMIKNNFWRFAACYYVDQHILCNNNLRHSDLGNSKVIWITAIKQPQEHFLSILWGWESIRMQDSLLLKTEVATKHWNLNSGSVFSWSHSNLSSKILQSVSNTCMKMSFWHDRTASQYDQAQKGTIITNFLITVPSITQPIITPN